MNTSSPAAQLEILVEERSMESFLQEILPRIFPHQHPLRGNYFIRSHRGKQHLLKSIPGKARAYRNYVSPVKLVVIHDQDSNDCKELKNKIHTLVRQNNPHISLLIRIACRELENWYLGDLPAVEKVYPQSKAGKYVNKAKFRHPDKLNGADEMRKMCYGFTKGHCAREIARHMTLDSNKSDSFRHFVDAIKGL